MRRPLSLALGTLFVVGCGQSVSDEIADQFDFDVSRADLLIEEHIAAAIVVDAPAEVAALEAGLVDDWDDIRAELNASITRMKDCNPTDNELHYVELAQQGIRFFDDEVEAHVAEQRRASSMQECLECEADFIGLTRNPRRIMEEASEDLRGNFSCREKSE